MGWEVAYSAEGSQQFTCLSFVSYISDGFLLSWECWLIACSWVLFVLSLSWFCVLTCLPKEGEAPVFANFLEMFKDGVAYNLCIFFLSKIWPGWMLSEVWFPFPLPKLFICACCVLAHIVVFLLQSPVQAAVISSREFDVLLNWSHQPQLRAVSVQRGPSFFEMNDGFLIKCLYFCTAEWFPGCKGGCLHRGTPQKWVLAT